MGVRDEPLGGDKMSYKNSKCTSDIIQNNSQKTSFNVNDTSSNMTWGEEQRYILQQCHEETIASKITHDSIPSHGFTCNCTECN